MRLVCRLDFFKKKINISFIVHSCIRKDRILLDVSVTIIDIFFCKTQVWANKA